jgi:hypothetical protein
VVALALVDADLANCGGFEDPGGILEELEVIIERWVGPDSLGCRWVLETLDEGSWRRLNQVADHVRGGGFGNSYGRIES